MVQHALSFCIHSGINKLILAVNPSDQDIFLREVGELAIDCESLQIVQQPLNKGTACAIELCEPLIRTAHTATLFGDNLYEYSMLNSVEEFVMSTNSVQIHTTEVTNPQDYAIVEFYDSKVVGIIDKPLTAISNHIMTGFMLFQTRELFKRIKHVSIDRFGEYNMMSMFPDIISDSKVEHRQINGWWIDAGTSIEHLYRAAILVHDTGINKSLGV
jgi:dTDP-glucose pyrophosphorylase